MSPVLDQTKNPVTACAEHSNQWAMHHPAACARRKFDCQAMSLHDTSVAARHVGIVYRKGEAASAAAGGYTRVGGRAIGGYKFAMIVWDASKRLTDRRESRSDRAGCEAVFEGRVVAEAAARLTYGEPPTHVSGSFCGAVVLMACADRGDNLRSALWLP